jgi:acyl-coenzyme A thioesterase PaaI-like protein
VTKGTIRCRTRVVQRGGRIAVLESHLGVGRVEVAQALGTFTIFAPRPAQLKRAGGAKDRRLAK